MRRALPLLVLAVALLGHGFRASAYVPIPARHLVKADGSRTYPGWVLFASNDGQAHLVNPLGRTVHTWQAPVEGDSIGHVEALDEPGHVLAFTNNEPIPGCGFSCGVAYELDFDGNVVWEYEDTARRLHHDLERLDNGNTLILCSNRFVDIDISPDELLDDCIIEVDPAGEVVWEWRTADHFSEFGFSDQARDLISETAGDWAHANSIDVIPEDIPNPTPPLVPGNIIVSYRHLSRIVIVDRLTEEIVWIADSTIGQHDAHLLPNSVPGAGNLLVFDNGGTASYPLEARLDSRVVEIDPATQEIVWQYDATLSGRPRYSFFSFFVSSARRLPNGNTFICEGMTGRMFEVTAEGRIVWELSEFSIGRLPDGTPSTSIYRAEKLPFEWAPLGPEARSFPAAGDGGAR